MKINVLQITFEPVEFIGKNFVGNKYLYRWVVYVEDDRIKDAGSYLRIKGKDIPCKVACIDTKPKVKQWLRDNKIDWKWEK